VADLILPYYKIPYTVETWASWYQIGTSSPTFHHPNLISQNVISSSHGGVKDFESQNAIQKSF